jgi:hypothetical protein
MAQFEYITRKHMEPRPGVKYATIYIRQTQAEHDRLLRWLAQVAEDILGIIRLDPVLAEWFQRPLQDFRKSQRGEYYTPEELIMDMLRQLAQGRDLAQSMLDRWNRLCESTPWQIELVQATQPKNHAREQSRADRVGR